MRAFLVALVAVPALVLAACAGVGYRADRPERFAPVVEKAPAYVEVFVACRKAGLEVQGRVVGEVVHFSCSPTLPSLGIGPVVARARR